MEPDIVQNWLVTLQTLNLCLLIINNQSHLWQCTVEALQPLMRSETSKFFSSRARHLFKLTLAITYGIPEQMTNAWHYNLSSTNNTRRNELRRAFLLQQEMVFSSSMRYEFKERWFGIQRIISWLAWQWATKIYLHSKMCTHSLIAKMAVGKHDTFFSSCGGISRPSLTL